jgi:hypothetical protein
MLPDQNVHPGIYALAGIRAWISFFLHCRFNAMTQRFQYLDTRIIFVVGFH